MGDAYDVQRQGGGARQNSDGILEERGADSDRTHDADVEVKLDARVIPNRAGFNYLGFIILGNREIDEDVAYCIRAGWMKWRLTFDVLCDRNVPLRLKGKFYRVLVRPAMLYGAECWPVKNSRLQKMRVAEMRMLRWMCGCTRRDRIKNEAIRDRVRVASVEDKMWESRLRWFRHVKRRSIDAPVRRCDGLDMESLRRGRGWNFSKFFPIINNSTYLIRNAP
uniref:Uncharacterized protein n=1 Tax=Nicotiana tabacum TaxID=4097 RepID=A0A1S3XIZ0_TOBAC|nr:PREDICTED: uncharacterized protein LOC107765498 [Nicotiana tabacum]